MPSVILKVLPHGCTNEFSLRRPVHENERSTPILHDFCDCRYPWLYYAVRYAYGTTDIPDECAGAERAADPNLHEHAILFIWFVPFVYGLVTFIHVFTVLPQLLVLSLIEPQ